MNKEIFSDAMNEIDPKYVEEALTYEPAKRLTFHVWARRCAAACLICVLGLGVVLAASPEARAGMRRWIETWKGDEVLYQYIGDNLEGALPVYELTGLPEGYVEDTEESVRWDTMVDILYRNEADWDNDIIIFGYLYMQQGTAMAYMLDEDDTVQEVTVNGLEGKLYLAEDPENWSVVEWIDPKTNLHFSIHACGDAETLLALAESVKPVE